MSGKAGFTAEMRAKKRNLVRGYIPLPTQVQRARREYARLCDPDWQGKPFSLVQRVLARQEMERLESLLS